jgi:hypothetical protein
MPKQDFSWATEEEVREKIIELVDQDGAEAFFMRCGDAYSLAYEEYINTALEELAGENDRDPATGLHCCTSCGEPMPDKDLTYCANCKQWSCEECKDGSACAGCGPEGDE